MLEDRIDNDLKVAFKAKDSTTVSTLRFLKSALKYARIEKREELNDDEIISVIKKQVKQRKDSIDEFKKGNRDDLVEKEAKELDILKIYLPEELGVEALQAMVKEAVTSLNVASVKDMGMVIKEVMAKSKGAADGKTVSELVRNEIALSLASLETRNDKTSPSGNNDE